MMDRTFLMVKPDGVKLGLVGEIIQRLEKKGVRIKSLEMLSIDANLAKKHYREHKEKPFFDDLISFITSGPVVAMVLEGPEVVKVVRKMVGSTDPKQASPGTIRGDFALEIGTNIVHASDSSASADREIKLFFG